jgi:hypothetical protein
MTFDAKGNPTPEFMEYVERVSATVQKWLDTHQPTVLDVRAANSVFGGFIDMTISTYILKTQTQAAFVGRIALHQAQITEKTARLNTLEPNTPEYDATLKEIAAHKRILARQQEQLARYHTPACPCDTCQANREAYAANTTLAEHLNPADGDDD